MACPSFYVKFTLKGKVTRHTDVSHCLDFCLTLIPEGHCCEWSAACGPVSPCSPVYKMKDTNAGLIHLMTFGATVKTFFSAVLAVREIVSKVHIGGVYVVMRLFSFLAGPIRTVVVAEQRQETLHEKWG